MMLGNMFVRWIASGLVCFLTLWISLPSASFAQDYVLGPRDVLRITVYEHQDLETRVRISEDGGITFPLLGEIAVLGLTVKQLKKKLTAMLGDGFIIDPHVNVFIDEFHVVVYVTGQVERPGSYPYVEGMTAIKAISLAGGLTERAAEAEIKVRRKTDGGVEETVPLRIHDLVQPNDVLQIPEKRWIYVTGEVRKPGSYLFDEKITIMKAIALAGGFTDKAAPGRAKIIRKQSDGKEADIRVKMNDSPQPEDIIVIPESYF